MINVLDVLDNALCAHIVLIKLNLINVKYMYVQIEIYLVPRGITETSEEERREILHNYESASQLVLEGQRSSCITCVHVTAYILKIIERLMRTFH